VAGIHELIARPIAVDFESGDVTAKRDLERPLGAEDELTDSRVQPVGADDQIDIARGRMIRRRIRAKDPASPDRAWRPQRPLSVEPGHPAWSQPDQHSQQGVYFGLGLEIVVGT
jgi:hypothetical protein